MTSYFQVVQLAISVLISLGDQLPYQIDEFMASRCISNCDAFNPRVILATQV